MIRQPKLPYRPGVELHLGRRTCWVHAPAGRIRTVLTCCGPVRMWDQFERCWMVPAQTAHELAKSLRRARFEVDVIEVDR